MENILSHVLLLNLFHMHTRILFHKKLFHKKLFIRNTDSGMTKNFRNSSTGKCLPKKLFTSICETRFFIPRVSYAKKYSCDTQMNRRAASIQIK